MYKEKQKLFVDFDDTLVDTFHTLVDIYNEEFMYDEKLPSNVKSYEWNFIDCFPKWSTKELYSQFNNKRMFYYYRYNKGALEVIRKLSKLYNVFIVSCGTYSNIGYKSLWLKKNLPDNIKTILIAVNENSKDGNQSYKSLINMKNDILIDDNLNALDCSNALVENRYVFGEEKTYNKTEVYYRLKTWDEVLNLLG